MCGLAGFWDPTRTASGDTLRSTVLGMADVLVRRGPDDRGAWVDPDVGVSLGFRRLSILDLSPEGHQPMASTSGRYILAFNGEIYNYQDVRRDLGPVDYRGHSDTEVMLAAFDRWGVEAGVQRLVGMFAFALWDRSERTLTLGRDRLGEKPLYYGQVNGIFLFGSELKALKAHPRFQGEIDRDAVSLYLSHGYIPAPYCIYQNFRKLMPGTLLSLKQDQLISPGEPRAYWSAEAVALAGQNAPFSGSDTEAIDHLETLLLDSVRRQMVADVPLGAFLSGGIDSSTVVALMQRLGTRPTRTFTIGFHQTGFDEARHARDVARHLGTDHTELYVNPDDLRDIIPELPRLYDEPFADSSSIPVFLVSRLARRDVTVCLSGDGGDELFAGYPWYRRTQLLWDRVRWMPGRARHTAAAALKRLAHHWPSRTVASKSSRCLVTGDRLLKLSQILRDAEGPENLHSTLMTRWSMDSGAIQGYDGSARPRAGWVARPEIKDTIGRIMLTDLITFLPDDVLTKVDRATMGVSLEARAPLLDHRVVEFAWQLPLALKSRDGRGKWPLRQVLYRYVPPALVDRPKMGFSVPISEWLRGPLRDWAESLLSTHQLEQDGLLDPGPILRRWTEHTSGIADWGTDLWYVLMLVATLNDSRESFG